MLSKSGSKQQYSGPLRSDGVTCLLDFHIYSQHELGVARFGGLSCPVRHIDTMFITKRSYSRWPISSVDVLYMYLCPIGRTIRVRPPLDRRRNPCHTISPFCFDQLLSNNNNIKHDRSSPRAQSLVSLTFFRTSGVIVTTRI